MGHKFIFRRIWGPRSLQFWAILKTLLYGKLCEYIKIPPKLFDIIEFKRGKNIFLDFYEISDFAIVNYIWNLTIYKVDEKKEIFSNAHLTFNFKQKPRVG